MSTTAADTLSGYDLRPLEFDAAGLASCAALLRRVFPRSQHVTPEYLGWEYTLNPDGEAFGWNAFAGDRLVSHCVVQPLQARLFGEDVRGVLSLNAATDVEHQRSGAYFELARRTYDEARERGYAFGVAVTNQRSTPGFVSHVGFECIRPLEARVGVGPVARRSASSEPDLRKLWSHDALAWRLACPTLRYHLGAAGGQLRIYGTTGVPGLAVEMADLEAHDEPAAARAGIERARLTPLRLWVGLDADIAWGRSAYLPLPAALRPSPLNLIFRDLTERGRTPDAERVRWRALDFDDF